MRHELLALAAESPDAEVCGLLFGDDSCIAAIAPAANVSPSPGDSFEIDPIALIAAHRATRQGEGARLIGWYHSHPNGVCEPSARDKAGEAGWLWLIIGGGKIGLWRSEADDLVPIPLC